MTLMHGTHLDACRLDVEVQTRCTPLVMLLDMRGTVICFGSRDPPYVCAMLKCKVLSSH